MVYTFKYTVWVGKQCVSWRLESESRQTSLDHWIDCLDIQTIDLDKQVSCLHKQRERLSIDIYNTDYPNIQKHSLYSQQIL